VKEFLLVFLGNVGRHLAEWADRQLEVDGLRLLERCTSLSPRSPEITADFFVVEREVQ
jgi:hypothetical protein